jgi:hypothetical protein
VGGVGGGLVVASEAAASSDPGEGALDDPAAGLDGKAGCLPGLGADQFNADRGSGGGDAWAGVGAVCEAEDDRGPAIARGSEEIGAAAAVVEVGGRDSGDQDAPVGVDERVALAPEHPLAAIEAARPCHPDAA